MEPLTRGLSSLSISEPQINMHISYTENLSMEELSQKIRNIPDPQVLLWYIGSYGLKEDCVKFYKEIIHDVIDKTDGSCHLLDLTAWGCFTNPKSKITASNKCADQINSFNITKLKCIKTSDLFGKMQYLQHVDTVDFFRNHIVPRPFLQNASSAFKETGIKICEAFKNNSPIFERIYEQDCSKCYSVVQYVEGCFLINDIVEKKLYDNGDINIVFALPNDEAKYYKDEENSFVEDAKILLLTNMGSKLQGRKVHIHFLNFSYGEELSNRPYNAGKKVLKKVTRDTIL